MDDNNLPYLVKKINTLSDEIQSRFYEYISGNLTPPFTFYEEEMPNYIEFWIEESTKNLYYLILTFLEKKGLSETYKTFKEKFSDRIDKTKNLLENKIYHPENTYESVMVISFFQFLDAFPEFDGREKNVDVLKKLNNILENTNNIIKKLQVIVNREEDIYKAVRWVIELYFPSVKAVGKASFIQQFKSYHPDILIPELKTAIEYKYIKTSKENIIENYIDQIKTDSDNYTGDSRFNNFIAVIHLKDVTIATPDRIKTCWETKKFPKNWNLIISLN
ncbi:PD-(D/E)XK nuclease domain-containing protein [Aureispira anguillae]|uniref:Uncharacterized protein n=1 Tax=Aureispira anguillae TaxID=2864201 RepID=A0A915YCL2_9BACT|nr:hypothetical protein [Aureispira anguillae]BDS10610.1 hypothetical protein AsAng_0013180 [Aureispira anguillae]